MAFIPILKSDDASIEARTVYEEFYQRMSFPSAPNFIMTQGHSPTVARGTWGVVENVLVKGEIARWTKEMIFVAISKDRSCRYCTAAHIACCRMLGVKSGLLDALVTDINSIPDDKLRDMFCLHSNLPAILKV
jgi:AhpD family alkylhydroperoxidase